MVTGKLLLGLVLLLETKEIQGIVECAKSAFEEYGKRGRIFPGDCEKKNQINTSCWVLCRQPSNSEMSISCNEHGLWEDNKVCSKDIHRCKDYSKNGADLTPGCNRDVNHSCIVSCNGGGFIRIWCNENEQWEEITTNCVLACPMVNVENAHTSKTNREVNSTFEIQCNDGFVVKGHEKMMCQRDYTWNHPVPICESRRFAHEVVKAMKEFFFPKVYKSNGTELDLILLLDVSRHQWVRITVDFVKSLFLHSEENQRRIFYSLITYEDKGQVQCRICNYTTIMEALDQVAKSQHQPAGSNLGSGLSRIFTQFLFENLLDRNRNRILLLVSGQTPGISHNHQLWTKILMEDADIKIFTVSLSDGAIMKDMEGQMKHMASQPWQEHYFHLEYSEIHDAVGNLTNNGRGIVNSTGQLVQQLKKSLVDGNSSLLFLLFKVDNSSTLVKQVAKNILRCLNQTAPSVRLIMGNENMNFSMNGAILEMDGLQVSTLPNVKQGQLPLIRNRYNYFSILLISSSGCILKDEYIHFIKDKGDKMYSVGVGMQAKMEELRDCVSFPWYQHLVHTSDGTVSCDD